MTVEECLSKEKELAESKKSATVKTEAPVASTGFKFGNNTFAAPLTVEECLSKEKELAESKKSAPVKTEAPVV